MFSQHQFGFLPGWSTLQQLLIFINEFLEAKNDKNLMTTDVIYLDFGKVFDSVLHAKLLSKLRSYVITGNFGSGSRLI